MATVAIAFGANLGNRRAALDFAVERLSFISNLVVSNAIETEPEGEGLRDQPLYLNAVAVCETSRARTKGATRQGGDREL